MINIDSYLTRRHTFDKYHCGHFVEEVWRDLTGESISEICSAFISRDAREYRRRMKQRVRLVSPEDPCIILMHAKQLIPHAGVFIENKILHLTIDGVRFQQMDQLDSRYRMSYYR